MGKRENRQVCIKLSGVISISIKSAARSDGDPHKGREGYVHGGSGGSVFFFLGLSAEKEGVDMMGYEKIIAHTL